MLALGLAGVQALDAFLVSKPALGKHVTVGTYLTARLSLLLLRYSVRITAMQAWAA